MTKRPTETGQEYRHRLSHSCYRCGWYTANLSELDRHEDHCDRSAR